VPLRLGLVYQRVALVLILLSIRRVDSNRKAIPKKIDKTEAKFLARAKMRRLQFYKPLIKLLNPMSNAGSLGERKRRPQPLTSALLTLRRVSDLRTKKAHPRNLYGLFKTAERTPQSPSVRPSIRPSVRPSARPLVHPLVRPFVRTRCVSRCVYPVSYIPSLTSEPTAEPLRTTSCDRVRKNRRFLHGTSGEVSARDTTGDTVERRKFPG